MYIYIKLIYKLIAFSHARNQMEVVLYKVNLIIRILYMTLDEA